MTPPAKAPALAAVVLALTPLVAQQPLSLDEAVRLALENNFAYRIARIEPEIARDEVARQESAFDSELFASGTVAQTERDQTFSQTDGTSTDTRSWQAGVRKRLVYGTTVTAQTTLDRRDSNAGVNTLSLSQAADFSVSVRQPLLGGFGRAANTAALEGARAGFAASAESFRDTVQRLVAQTELSYWAAAAWQERLELNRSNLKVAETLLDEARERERVGLATQIDVLQAEALRASRMEEIIASTRSLGDAVDSLLALTGTLPATPVAPDAPAHAVDPLPDTGREPPEFQALWTLALERDPALAAQAAVIRQRESARLAARGAAKPSLDLVLSGGYDGLDGEDAGDAYRDALDREGTAWAVGLEFTMPWGMRGEKADLRAAGRRVDQESLRYEELRQALFQQVRSAWRNLEAVSQSVAAARLTVSLQEASFQREMGKYEEGLSTFRAVLESQSDLDQARIRLLQARYSRLEAEVELARLSGAIFERHGILPELPALE